MSGMPRDYNPRNDTSATAVQPAPTGKDLPVGAFVLADIQGRIALGKKKYGTELRTNNGRDALTDAYQEVLDLAMYLKQEILERRAMRWQTEPRFSEADLLTQKELAQIENVAMCNPSSIRKILLLQAFAKAHVK